MSGWMSVFKRSPKPRPRPAHEPAKLVPAAPVVSRVRSHLLGELEIEREMNPDGDHVLIIEALIDMGSTLDLGVPRLSGLAGELARLDVNSTESGRAVAAMISRDQDVSARVMKLSNSSLFGTRQVQSLDEAVVRLGVELVREAALGVTTGVIYRIPGYEREAKLVRARCFAVGIAANRLARRPGAEMTPGHAFLAGMFHDIGEIILLRCLSRLRRHFAQPPSRDLTERISAKFHEQLGILFCVQQELPPKVCAVVGTHHDPSSARAEVLQLAWTVWAVERVLRQLGLNGEDLGDVPEAWPDAAPSLDRVVAAAKSGRDIAKRVLHGCG